MKTSQFVPCLGCLCLVMLCGCTTPQCRIDIERQQRYEAVKQTIIRQLQDGWSIIFSDEIPPNSMVVTDVHDNDESGDSWSATVIVGELSNRVIAFQRRNGGAITTKHDWRIPNELDAIRLAEQSASHLSNDFWNDERPDTDDFSKSDFTYTEQGRRLGVPVKSGGAWSLRLKEDGSIDPEYSFFRTR